MPPKEKKKAVKKKAPAYLTSEADMAPFGVVAGQLVINALRQTGVVLGVRYERPGDPQSAQLWVKWDRGGLEAPVDTSSKQFSASPVAKAARAGDVAGGSSSSPASTEEQPQHAGQPCISGQAGTTTVQQQQQQQKQQTPQHTGFVAASPAEVLRRDAAALAAEQQALAAKWALYDAEKARAAEAAKAAAKKKRRAQPPTEAGVPAEPIQ